MSFCRDPRYYQNPEEFLPERFIDGEQRYRNKGMYLSFGEGPRSCIGVRFALCQMKFALVHIVKNYFIELSPKHKPIVIDPHTLISFPTDGILVKFIPRS